MSKLRLAPLVALGCLLVPPGPAGAQTANGSPTAPAPRSLDGTPSPISRMPPSVGGRRGAPGAAVTPGAVKPPRPPTAAERAEQRKLEHDLNICIGC